MIIIPAIDIKEGKCVQLVQGKPGSEQVVIDDPVYVSKMWEKKGAKLLHIVDLDGAFGTGNNLKIVKKILNTVSIPIQFGGGIRTKKYAEKLLNLGIKRIILGTIAIKKPKIVEKLVNIYGSERIMVALDSKSSKVVVEGWTKTTTKNPIELAKLFQKIGVGSILYTNVDVEGLMSGIETKIVKKLVKSVNIPIVYSGGVSSIEDIKKLKNIGVYGVVIGSALYKGKINLKEVLEYEK
ncbi:1-(5-phosphoribosyl)-5-((5-phosphoribosylamino)methylideneamino) imidazole-4-carboxamide isomerase [Methanothermus fervidus DSM 2088]|uniref:1-(5-phosphoribosyl)-5-[(5-phosphoribosylamino)methylideneamino] imidazole-4-carboxamide isomerase n=1 Tax=Methanothermus fervidus (strain ATCC 43054 / DSM 2088 / JCM 10308 / V24 S) TaxID=523846 RepID=E3GWP0_METFV|nr:1-(5-phosphoribosyl)-5-[(5-phosphoribosylamino)methylideneamino]imidazole-4-carboxamide isomerase [Methanothermus fervidus]ADP77959.1 1-(5-phosphoribosyl)-5-((5-phosphoribosylamino)methylideneamino) imidazole-4-carboxamide isomerase [Methanothermus fervidus DSM 2088]